MSQILCIIDGMTDPDFMSSRYPCLSSMGRSGFVDTCQGQEPESLGCILRLLGIRHVPPYLRGYAEALGAGIPVGQQDLIMRGSWFGLDQQGCCTGPVPGPESLSVDCNCRYYHLESYKSLLVFPGLAREISKITTHPPYHCTGVPAVQMHPEGSAAAESLCRQCQTSRRCLIPWGQSIPASLPLFSVPAAVICGTQVVKGIARLLAMDLPDVPNAIGDTDTDLHAKAAAALAAESGQILCMVPHRLPDTQVYDTIEKPNHPKNKDGTHMKNEKLKEILRKDQILSYRICDYSRIHDFLPCRNRERIPAEAKSVIVCAFPYYTGEHPGANVCKYAGFRTIILWFAAS